VCYIMAPMTELSDNDGTARLAATLQAVRVNRGLSVNALADLSGVSRAMIGKIERGEAQPTAALLGRLIGPLEMTMSELFAHVEAPTERLSRKNDQPLWTDPETGYRRRAVSPPHGHIQLVEVELPPGKTVSFPPDSFATTYHQIWVLAGRLRFREGAVDHDLRPGDCLELGAPQSCSYTNPTGTACRYLVALTKKP
jgi:transcriptional regulator with XRE-family HTH domain